MSIPTLRFAALLAVVLVAAVQPSAAEQSPDQVGGLLRWAPLVPTGGMTLSLADPGGAVRTLQFAAGETPSLSLFDPRGFPLADGTYTWELRGTSPGGADRPLPPLVQSGHFTIAGGNLIDPDLAEPAEAPRRRASSPGLAHTAAADQIVPDDFIVDGKGCIGLGCVNSEAFGVEALRLKQSVVRLRFEDTSTPEGLFPSNDWQITVNDAGSGGASKFSIEDLTGARVPVTVLAGAPTDSLVVNGVGNVGLGTATPTSTLNLRRTGAQVWVTDTTGTTGGRALFVLENNGNNSFVIQDTSPDGSSWQFSNLSNSSIDGFVISRQGDGYNEFIVKDNGDVHIAKDVYARDFLPTSSRELKEGFTAIDAAAVLAKLARLPVTEWSFKDDPERRRHLGPTVEDFQATFGFGTSGRSLVITDVNGVALVAIQALHAQVQSQRLEIVELQREIERVKSERR